MKKAVSVNAKKALEFWSTQQVVKLVIEWKMSSYSVDISTLCELLLLKLSLNQNNTVY